MSDEHDTVVKIEIPVQVPYDYSDENAVDWTWSHLTEILGNTRLTEANVMEVTADE